jgi:hypothetical protein
LSGGIVALAVWLSVLPSMTQEASAPQQTTRVAAVDRDASERVSAAHDSLHQDVNGSRKNDRVVAPDDQPRDRQQSASSLPAAGHLEPQVPLPRERPQIRGNGDPMTSRAFATRNPGVTKSELARADDMFSHALRLGADDAVAGRAQQRPVRSGAQAFAEEDRVMSRAPASSGSPARPSLEERAAGFVSSQIAGWSSANTSNPGSANVYAEKVLYYGSYKPREAVLLDKRRHIERWPEQVYDVQRDSITVKCLDNVCKVSGLVSWQARNDRREASTSGISQFEYKVALSRDAFKILSESSAVVKRYAQDDRRTQSRRAEATAHQQR